MTNEYGLNYKYFQSKLSIVAWDAENYTPDEMARELARLSISANDKVILGEPEFNHISQAGKKVVSKMESTTSDGWISVDEHPKEHGRYWCFVEYISDLGRSSYHWNCSWNQCEGRWGDLAEEGGIVTHWQPLPKPPETLK